MFKCQEISRLCSKMSWYFKGSPFYLSISQILYHLTLSQSHLLNPTYKTPLTSISFAPTSSQSSNPSSTFFSSHFSITSFVVLFLKTFYWNSCIVEQSRDIIPTAWFTSSLSSWSLYSLVHQHWHLGNLKISK